ncbi:MAG: flavin reductase [Gemmatimonadetes bacterium]|nr:flavin reductase [Gemmatimonadota bacterium]
MRIGEGTPPDPVREAFARWASGVTILAVDDEGEALAMVASAFTPLSLDPPLALVCLRADAAILPDLEDVGRFTLSLLAEGQRRLASSLVSGNPVPADAFDHTPDPVLRGALATLVCAVHALHPGGDHRIVVGRVERVVPGPAGAPLLYHAREYRTLA